MSKTLILMNVMALAVLASETGFACVEDDSENVRCFSQLQDTQKKTMSLDDIMKMVKLNSYTVTLILVSFIQLLFCIALCAWSKIKVR